MKFSYLIVTAVTFGTFVSGNRIWVNYLRSKGKTVTIACSTGIASTHYGKLGGTTLHKWSGIGDDRYLNEEIVHLIKTDERFNDVKDNVQSTNTLIIDEISSSSVLGQVQFICQKVRSSSVLFGNLQVILAGDFFTAASSGK
jgi:hypothetical protein